EMAAIDAVGRDAEGARVTLCARPEHLRTGAGVSLGVVRVIEAVFQGMHRKVTVLPEAAPDTPLRARLPVGLAADVGDLITLALDAEHLTLLEDT
ncbi:MAG: TOBE domain-containing protein, partial [Rhodobacterales bacterium]